MRSDEITSVLSADPPSEWRFIRGKYFMKEVDVRSVDGSEELLSLSRDWGVVPRSEIVGGEPRADTLVGYKRVRSGQLVMNKMQAWNGMFGLSSYDGLVSPDYAVFEINYRRADSRFVTSALRSRFYSSQFRWRSRGMGTAFLRLHPENLLDTPLPLPPLDRQGDIADFLDAEVARTDALVEMKRRVIALANERLRSTIDSVLSREAQRARLGRFVTFLSQGTSPEAENREAEPDEWAVLKLSAVRFGRYRPSENKALPADYQPDNSLVPRYGDLLVTRSNTPAYVGDACAVTEDAPNRMLCDLIYLIRLDPRLDAQFGAYALLTSDARLQLESAARGSSQSMVKLRGEDIKTVEIPYVSREQQPAIVEEIESRRSRLDRLVSKAERQIELLRERRQALITAAVTGQLDIAKVAR